MSDCFDHHQRLGNLVVLGNDPDRAFDDPAQDCSAALLVEVVGVVLDVAVALNDRVKRDHNKPSPCTGIQSADLRQVIGIEHQRVGGYVGERVLVLLLGVDFVSGA